MPMLGLVCAPSSELNTPRDSAKWANNENLFLSAAKLVISKNSVNLFYLIQKRLVT